MESEGSAGATATATAKAVLILYCSYLYNSIYTTALIHCFDMLNKVRCPVYDNLLAMVVLMYARTVFAFQPDDTDNAKINNCS